MSMDDFFYINKTDRIVLTLVIVVICLLTFALFVIDRGSDDIFVVSPRDSVAIADGRLSGKGDDAYYNVDGKRAELFPFDPNTADSTQLLRLGLRPWQVRAVYRYRAAGGVYSCPSDFARLYGLTLKQYRKLEPYIRISNDYRPASDFVESERPSYADRSHDGNDGYVARDTTKYPRKLRPGETIPLNTADTSLLKRVPGIGSGYALAIVRRRERLGGFYSERQLLEIDGLPEQALQYLTVGQPPRRININRLTFSQLRQHPYINYYQARDIVDYRRLHGNIKSLSALRLLQSFTPTDLERLSHYVEF